MNATPAATRYFQAAYEKPITTLRLVSAIAQALAVAANKGNIQVADFQTAFRIVAEYEMDVAHVRSLNERKGEDR